MERKAALIGCKQGSWIRTSGMKKLRLNARVRHDVIIYVAQKNSFDQESRDRMFVGPGLHELDESTWTIIRIADGPWIDALCLLESSN